jgi:hypothetical protein
MWFYPLVLVLVILALAGGTLLGGVYTIILVPLAAVVVVSLLIYALWGRALQGREGVATDADHVSSRPLPHRRRRPSGRAPTSPEALTDARRQQQ